MRSSDTCYLLLTFISDRKICLWLMLINMMLWLAFPVDQWAVLFSLEFLDLLELYLLWQSKQKLAVFTSYGFADWERTEHFSFCVWKQSKILAHIHEAGVNREGSILSPSPGPGWCGLALAQQLLTHPFVMQAGFHVLGFPSAEAVGRAHKPVCNIMDGFSSQPRYCLDTTWTQHSCLHYFTYFP